MLSGARRGGLPWGVAGKIRAMISKPSPLSSSFPPYKPSSTRSLLQSFNPRPHRLPSRLSSFGQFLAMDQKGEETKSPETKEPVSKIQKLDHNGASEVSTPLLRVKRLSEFAVLPTRASPLSAGYDLSSAKQITIPGRGKALVPTDLSIAIPEGTYARIAPRSGLALKHSIDVGAGVIDADYRGPVGVILFNHSDADFDVKAGDRIAQLIIQKILTPDVAEVEDLDSTERGVGGFGSTGL